MAETSRDLLPQVTARRPPASAANVLAGAASLGGRAGANAVEVVVASIRPAARPAVALLRVGLRSPVGVRARSGIGAALDALDRAGRDEREQARAAADRFVNALLDRVAVRLVGAGLVERVTAELIAAEVPERVAVQVADAHVVEAIVEQLIAANTMDRLAETVLESSLYDDVVDRVLESEELWRIVERIAQSPEVMSAITAGSASLANEVGDQVRRRTIVADDVAERIARRILRRAPRDRGGAGSADAT